MEKKQHNSVFQIFILKNKLKKTEIAQYLGVSNASRSTKQTKTVLIISTVFVL